MFAVVTAELRNFTAEGRAANVLVRTGYRFKKIIRMDASAVEYLTTASKSGKKRSRFVTFEYDKISRC